MKINNLIDNFQIQMSNEERALYDTLDYPMPYDSFSEREQFVIENLNRKSLISKIRHVNMLVVVRNDY
jgi:hypothetical protein